MVVVTLLRLTLRAAPPLVLKVQPPPLTCCLWPEIEPCQASSSWRHPVDVSSTLPIGGHNEVCGSVALANKGREHIRTQCNHSGFRLSACTHATYLKYVKALLKPCSGIQNEKATQKGKFETAHSSELRNPTAKIGHETRNEQTSEVQAMGDENEVSL